MKGRRFLCAEFHEYVLRILMREVFLETRNLFFILNNCHKKFIETRK